MFQIRITGRKQGLEIIFRCPSCDAEHTFCFYSPEMCQKCLKKMPNITELLSCKDDKMAYHKHGYTISPHSFNKSIRTVLDEGD